MLSRVAIRGRDHPIQGSQDLLRIIHRSSGQVVVFGFRRHVFGLKTKGQVRNANQLVRRGSFQVSHGRTHSTSSLLLATEGHRYTLIRIIFSFVPSNHLLRTFFSTLVSGIF